MTLTEYLETLTVADEDDTQQPLRFSFKKNVYRYTGATYAETAPPQRMPYVTIRRRAGRPSPSLHARWHDGTVINQALIRMELHHRLTDGELSPPDAAIYALYNDLLKVSEVVTEATDDRLFVPPYRLDVAEEPEETPNGGLMGLIVWRELTQLYVV